MVKLDLNDHSISIDDIGVTIRTLLAVAATGYAETDRRKWSIKYKGVAIGNVQVASTPKVAAKSKTLSDDQALTETLKR